MCVTVTWLQPLLVFFAVILLVADFRSAQVRADLAHRKRHHHFEIEQFPHSEVLNDNPATSHRMRPVHDVAVEAVDNDEDEDEDDGDDGCDADVCEDEDEKKKKKKKKKPSSSILKKKNRRNKKKKKEKKTEEVEGPLKLKVDDKDGLVKDGPYKKKGKKKKKKKKEEGEDQGAWPKICDEGGVPCTKVDSRVRPGKASRALRRRMRLRHKRSAPGRPPRCQKEASIEAFGSNYTLCLFLRDFSDEAIVKRSWDSLNVTVFGERNASRDIAVKTLKGLQYAAGYVKGEDFTSVTGFLMDEHFYGTVYMRDTVHYLEPHDRKSRDMHIFGDGLKTLLHKHEVKDSREMKDNLPGSEGRKSQQQQQKSTPQRRLCDLTIVADHLFYADVGERSIEKTILQMLYHIKEANALFESKDFDDDGRSECIGFTVSEMTIFTTADSAVNLLVGEYDVPEDFLKRFSRYNFDGFCLGVLFTNRAFSELVLGLSWRGNPKPDGVGGICQARVRIRSDRNAYSFNALFISLKSSQESRIPLRMGVLNLVHEMMHSFGAKHDPDPVKNPACTPRDKWVNGRYLMSKFSNDGHKLNHEILSPCTKDLVRRNLASPTRVSCLDKVSGDEAFCGDGVVQPGEDCDCGTVFQCIAARSCCAPPEGGEPGGRGPEGGGGDNAQQQVVVRPCKMRPGLKACVK